MDVINSWIDEKEVSRLAKSLSEVTDSKSAQKAESSEEQEVVVRLTTKVEQGEAKTTISESESTKVTKSPSVEAQKKPVSWLKKGNSRIKEVENQLADKAPAALNKGVPVASTSGQLDSEKADERMINTNAQPEKSTVEVAKATTPAVKAMKSMTPDKGDHEIGHPVALEGKEEVAEQVIVKQGSMLAGASLLAKSAGVIHAEAIPEKAEVTNIPSASINNVSIEEIAKKQASEELDRDDSAAVFVRTDIRGTFASMQAAVESKYKIKGLCAIDQDGDVLYNSFADDSVSKFTSKVMRDASLMKITDGEVGSMRIKKSVDCILEFVSVKCTRGIVLIAMGMAEPLNKEKTEIIAAELLEILNKD